jgi:hypothetical protein
MIAGRMFAISRRIKQRIKIVSVNWRSGNSDRDLSVWC